MDWIKILDKRHNVVARLFYIIAMHIFLEPSLFVDRVHAFLNQWRNLSKKKLLIIAKKEPFQKIYFKCDNEGLEIPARVKEPGQVLVGAENAVKALGMYSRIDEVELFTSRETLVIKQRNFTMSLPCFTDEDLEKFTDALSVDRIAMLRLEKRRLKEEINRIDEEINSMSRVERIRKRF